MGISYQSLSPAGPCHAQFLAPLLEGAIGHHYSLNFIKCSIVSALFSIALNGKVANDYWDNNSYYLYSEDF